MKRPYPAIHMHRKFRSTHQKLWEPVEEREKSEKKRQKDLVLLASVTKRQNDLLQAHEQMIIKKGRQHQQLTLKQFQNTSFNKANDKNLNPLDGRIMPFKNHIIRTRHRVCLST